jgi:hypothetical protein
MRGKSGRANLLRRIEALESRSVDGSRLAPHSPQWLAFWQEQFHLYDTGQPHAQLTLEAVRAVMQAIPDDAEEDVEGSDHIRGYENNCQAPSPA